MIDLHCHILPNVDDGPSSLEEALTVARFCVRDGITHITATPHCHKYLRILRAEILPHVAWFNAQLERAGVPLIVLPGAEIQLANVLTYKQDFEASLYCHLGDGPDFTLLEMPWDHRHYPEGAADLVGYLRGRGMTPIIAHPERQTCFRNVPARLRALVEAGAWIQLTVDSFLGNHGPHAQSAADELLRTYSEVILATDAHNPRRCSGLSAGYSLIAEQYGADRANDLRSRAEDVLRQLLSGEELAGEPGTKDAGSIER